MVFSSWSFVSSTVNSWAGEGWFNKVIFATVEECRWISRQTRTGYKCCPQVCWCNGKQQQSSYISKELVGRREELKLSWKNLPLWLIIRFWKAKRVEILPIKICLPLFLFGRSRLLLKLNVLLGLLFWIRLILMICHKCASLIKLSPNVLCSENYETNHYLFLCCEMALQLWNKLFSKFRILRVCPPTLDSFLSTRYCGFGMNKGKNALWKVQDLLFYGVYGWKGTLESLNKLYQQMVLVWYKILFVTSLWLKAHSFFWGISLTDYQRIWKSILDPR